jgi:hypothetical protein
MPVEVCGAGRRISIARTASGKCPRRVTKERSHIYQTLSNFGSCLSISTCSQSKESSQTSMAVVGLQDAGPDRTRGSSGLVQGNATERRAEYGKRGGRGKDGLPQCKKDKSKEL